MAAKNCHPLPAAPGSPKGHKMQKINPQWTVYNNIHNEGGEGYNPHPKHISTGGGEPLWSKLQDRADRLQRIQNGTSPSDSRYAELEAERAEVLAALDIANKEGI